MGISFTRTYECVAKIDNQECFVVDKFRHNYMPHDILQNGYKVTAMILFDRDY